MYCGDHLKDYGILYLQGENGDLVNMHIDCDGVQGDPTDDGRCGHNLDIQANLAFTDLNSNIMPYVVLGNVNGTSGNSPQFRPQQYGIEPLSLVAVVCGSNLVR